MAPPSAISPERAGNHQNGDQFPSARAPHEPGISESKAKVQMPKFPQPPTFADKYAEREYLKGMLSASRADASFAAANTSKVGWPLLLGSSESMDMTKGLLDISPCEIRSGLTRSGSTLLVSLSHSSRRVI